MSSLPSGPPGRAERQRGAALAVALILLVVLTLLGVAAVRSTQTELRLAQNAESRSGARQAAESLISVILADPENTPVNDDPNFLACYLPAGISTVEGFRCTASNRSRSIVLIADSGGDAPAANAVPALVAAHGQIEVARQLPLFVAVDVLREAQTSARQYDFARYTLTARYDRAAEGLSAAEVTESRLILHNKVVGVNYE